MSNNEHWNTVNWSHIPEDVEAVVMYPHTDPTYYKMGESGLICQCYRVNGYFKSSWSNYDKILKQFGDCFHLRPTPAIQPTLEPPESTQIESSQVWATSVLDFDWSTVEDDVDGVSLLVKRPPATPPLDKVGVELVTNNCWISSDLLGTPFSELNDIPPYVDQNGTGMNTAYEVSKVEKVGGEIQVEYVTLEKPSIQSILSDAQELIKKHHNITGEVKFTIKCS